MVPALKMAAGSHIIDGVRAKLATRPYLADKFSVIMAALVYKSRKAFTINRVAPALVNRLLMENLSGPG
jgi:hypothetical protein